MAKRGSTMHRFFLLPFVLKGQELCIRDKEHIHQLSTVLRMRVDDRCVFLDNKGGEYTTRLTLVSKKEIQGVVEETVQVPLSERRIVLCFGVLKGPRNEYIMEKATELGATELQPVLFERCQPFGWNDNKVRRYEAIIKEATEQSEGVIIPLLHPPRTLQEVLRAMEGSGIVAWESADAENTGLHSWEEKDGQALYVFVGPEGGITEGEIVLMQNAGVQELSLGKRILRAETAAVVLLTKVLFMLQ